MEDISQLTCLLCCSSYYPIKLEVEEDDGSQGYFSSFLSELQLQRNFSLDETAVCSVCFAGIKRAMCTRRKVFEMESHVQDLQSQILVAMKQMESILRHFYKDMKWIQEIVETSSENIQNLEYQSNSRKYKRDVDVFRKSIIDVVGSLAGFNTDLATKNINREASINLTVKSQLAGTASNLRDKNESDSEQLDDEEDEDFHFPGEEFDDNYDDSDKEYCQNIVYKSGLKKDRIRTKPLKKNQNAANHSKTHKHKYKDKNSNDVNSVAGPSSSPPNEDNDENDDDKLNYLIKNKNKLLSQLSRKYDFQPSAMSMWKKTILPRMFHAAEDFKIPTKCSNGSIKFCVSPKQHSVRYDNSNGQLFFAEYPIILQDKDQKVICGHCKYEVKSSAPTVAPRYIIEHILGNHLGAYTCEDCGASYKSCNKYRVHLSSHTKAIICEICGKPLSTPEYVRTHLWTHMSKEEQEEAIKNGEKDRRKQWERYKHTDKVFVCSVCGTSFKTPRQLRTHDLVHVSVEERLKFLCPHCGKIFMRQDTLQKHLDKSCIINRTPEELSSRLHCDRCTNTFKSMRSWKYHRKTVHGVKGDKMYRCTMCPPNEDGLIKFPTQTAFIIHNKKVHEGKNVWMCLREGCGKEFLKKSKLIRHQQTRICVRSSSTNSDVKPFNVELN